MLAIDTLVAMRQHVRFHERLVPGWWVFASAVGFVAMIAIAYGAVLGSAVGWLVLLTGTGCACAVLLIASPVVWVDEDGLHAGPATLPFSAVSAVEVLDAAQTRAARGPQADPRLFAMLRPSRSAESVLVSIDDPGDPHPAWLLTSRRPHELAAALG